MLEIASQMILCLLLAALIGAIIGYILGKSTCADDDCGENNTKVHADDTHSTQGIASTNTETSAVATAVAATATATEHVSVNSESIGIQPALLTTARNGKADNLTHINGVDVKLEEELNNSGVYHYDQIASWDSENMEWANDALGFPGRAQKEEWVPQAKILASGKETESSKSVDGGEVDSSTANKPVVLSEARNGKADNLTRIKGIGAKIEDELNKVGIYHFDQIASWGDSNIQWADDALGFPGRAKREKWVSQASTLASGEATEFSKRVDAGEVDSSNKS